jgi:hypothetical protein
MAEGMLYILARPAWKHAESYSRKGRQIAVSNTIKDKYTLLAAGLADAGHVLFDNLLRFHHL